MFNFSLENHMILGFNSLLRNNYNHLMLLMTWFLFLMRLQKLLVSLSFTYLFMGSWLVNFPMLLCLKFSFQHGLIRGSVEVSTLSSLLMLFLFLLLSWVFWFHQKSWLHLILTWCWRELIELIGIDVEYLPLVKLSLLTLLLYLFPFIISLLTLSRIVFWIKFLLIIDSFFGQVVIIVVVFIQLIA